MWEQCFLISFHKSLVVSSLRWSIAVHYFFFLIHIMGEVEEKLLTVKEVKLKMHFYRRKSHHLHQNWTRSTYKPTAIKQMFKESKNTKSKISYVWVLQCSPGSHRESQTATSYQSFHRSQWQLEIPSFFLEVQALLEVLTPARGSITRQNIVLSLGKCFVSWSSLVCVR